MIKVRVHAFTTVQETFKLAETCLFENEKSTGHVAFHNPVKGTLYIAGVYLQLTQAGFSNGFLILRKEQKTVLF